MSATIQERLDRGSISEPNTGCILWLGVPDKRGYGRIRYQGRGRRAHRVAYELVHGPIPTGLLVCHKCDVRACINPMHMFLGTAEDNMKDAMSKGRHCFGSRHGIAKLTEEQAMEIDRLLKAQVAQKDIAGEMGVSPDTVHNIAVGRTWAHATGRIYAGTIRPRRHRRALAAFDAAGKETP